MLSENVKAPQIFLCHASEDKDQVLETYKRIKQEGLKPWLDKEDLLPGQNWQLEIPKAIKASDFVLIFFSTTSVAKRGYIQKEFKLALDVLDEIPEDQLFIIPVRLDNCQVPEKFHHLHYCDLFEESGIEQVVKAIQTQSGVTEDETIETTQPVIRLRSQPMRELSKVAAKKMLAGRGFYDRKLNKNGRGFANQFEPVECQWESLIIDENSGLTWQQSGSQYYTYKEAQEYIEELNNTHYAGYSNWRLPTLEEAMSLLEPNKNKDGLYINHIFDKTQWAIWTSDKNSASFVWVVYFFNGTCNFYHIIFRIFVRAVR